MAGLCTPWGPGEKVKPLRKRLPSNLQEDPNEDYQSRDDDSTISVVPPLKEIYSNHQVLSVPGDSRGRTPRARSDPESSSSNLPPVNHMEQPRRASVHRADNIAEKNERYDNYMYLNNSSGLSKSTENFSVSESDPRMKRKSFLSGDRVLDMGSYDKMPTDRSLYSSSYQLRNSNLSLATDGDATWREWGLGRGNVEEMRPRWGDRGINTGQPWNAGGQPPPPRIGDNPGGPDEYPTPGWVERGLSRMSGDGRGRGSAESPRNDPGIRVFVSDENGGVQRVRGSISESQNLAYMPAGRFSNENYPPRNYDGHSSALPYVGEMPSMHSSASMHQRHDGSFVDERKGEGMFVAERDACNASDISHSGRSYGYNGCISAPNNNPPIQKFKKNDDVTASLPNLQSTSTHLRGQNVPVDPEVIVERELRRLKAMELQKAIRQQLEEREKMRLQEKELRMKEERAIEERLRKQQEAERLKKEEEERKQREKEVR
ncbi:uncharacterized protein LOC124163722 [Ischnura elegans]|uniref:uncharacterized protein LOC124163722 n=1 Tax=Ischnura elegans TaxID=197161 RepID=UPI001ED8A9FF|nr:uncharacterized protein LOC124163722 [Ischnura elegans]